MKQTVSIFAEFLGSLLLAGVVIGSGILALELSDGNLAVALLGNTIATGAILWVLVATLGPVSGAHFNPAVTLAFFLRREISMEMSMRYVAAQIAGCVLGAVLAHAMFELPLLQISETNRSGLALMLSEGVATFALVFAIFGAIKHAPKAVPMAVALVIVAGYWWTASTSFANPAISMARALSDTFAGVSPAALPGFILAQCLGAALATGTALILFPKEKSE
ncbi:MAG: MIP/aquaporin family protein [Pseudomonadota bacterium]